ncbi:MAG: DEAD/DEAH box helicase [Gemmatales bacterium]
MYVVSENSEPAREVTLFAELQLRPALLDVIAQVGYITPSPIQARFIPAALTGKDIIGKAQTGTGKTCAFLLPIINQLNLKLEPPQVLILSPTRELTQQIAEETLKFAKPLGIRSVAIMGGERFDKQIRGLQEGAQIVIGTPGRIIDLQRRGNLRLGTVRYVVLDEADRMLDIGFRPDIERILRNTPSDRQTLLLSATLPDGVMRLALRYMDQPQTVDVSPEKLTVDSIRQTFFTVDEDRKFALLKHVLVREQPKQCIIFTATKRGADQLHRMLMRSSLKNRLGVLHGDLSQGHRKNIMARFRTGEIRVLVATDVVSRGIDVTGISHIINYDLPEDPESYVHRIGRTGRMGKDGIAIAFIVPGEGRYLTEIEKLMNTLVEEDFIPGFEAVRPRVRG